MPKRPCPACGTATWTNLRGTPSGWVCDHPDCGDFRPHGVGNVSAWRSAIRTHMDRGQFTHDTIPPHTYDKLTKRMVINPEFVKHHGRNARQWYRPAELKQAGYDRLAETVQKQRDADGVLKDLGGAR